MTDRTIIKKYGNRRLYDTTRSRYINLEDIPAILKSGSDVEVRDASTNEEITAAVLLQLIVEREKRKVEGLPLDLLKEFVILQDTPGRRFFDQAIRQGLAVLREMKKAGLPSVESAATWLDPAAWMARFFPGASGAEPSHAGAAHADPSNAHGDAPDAPPDAPADGPEEPPEPNRSGAAPQDSILKQLEELKKRLERIERKRR